MCPNNSKGCSIASIPDFLHDVEQTKSEMATLGQQMRKLQSELQKRRVTAVEKTFRHFAPIQEGKQKLARFCKYCRKNGHTLFWCRKKMPEPR